MAYLGETYNVDGNDVAGDYTPVPPGEYVVQVEASDIKDAKKAGNKFIELTLTIMEGPEVNRKLTDRINLWNDNPKAVEIARRSLNSLGVACGKMAIGDTNEVHGIPMIAVVKVDPAKPYVDRQTGEQKPGSPSNSIAAYKPLSQRGAAGATAAPAAPAGNAATPAAGSGAAAGGFPWNRSQQAA